MARKTSKRSAEVISCFRQSFLKCKSIVNPTLEAETEDVRKGASSFNDLPPLAQLGVYILRNFLDSIANNLSGNKIRHWAANGQLPHRTGSFQAQQCDSRGSVAFCSIAIADPKISPSTDLTVTRKHEHARAVCEGASTPSSLRTSRK
jgi:hypothetical protein